MTRLTTVSITLAFALGFASVAMADPFNPVNLSPSVGGCGLPVCLVESGTSHSGENVFNAYVESTYSVQQLYKINAGGTEAGVAAPWYGGSLVPVGNESGGSITWNGPGAISGPPIYVAVKDGNNDPYWYLFNITGWNGTATINLSGFWPTNGAISHVSIYGTGTSTNVPDGGVTLMLLGGALVGLESLRRKFRA